MHDCNGNLVGILDGQGKIVRLICRSSRSANLIRRALINCTKIKGIIGVEVMSLSSFLSERARELGLESQIIGSMGREMKLQLLLEGEKSWVPDSKEKLSQYVSDFNSAISMLKSYGISAGKVQAAAGQNGEKKALARVYKAYTQWLQSSGYLDVEDLWDRICTSGNKGSRYLNMSVGFDGDRLSERKLEALNVKSLIPKELFRWSKVEDSDNPMLVTLKARQGMQLAREIARHIKHRHIEKSIGYSEFCICVPGSSKASQEVAAAMDWAGIPCTEPVWMNLADHPVGYSVLLLCELISARKQKLDAFRYMRNPYFGIADAGKLPLLKGKAKTKGLLLTLTNWAEDGKYNRYFRMNEKDPDFDLNSIAQKELKAWADGMLSDCESLASSGAWDELADRFLAYLDKRFAYLNDEALQPALRALEEKAWAGLKDILSKIIEAGKLVSQDGAEVNWSEFSYTLAEALQRKRILVKGASPLGVAVAELADVAGLSFDTTVIYEPTEVHCPSAEKPSWLLREDELPFFDSGIQAVSRDKEIRLEKERFMAAADTARQNLVLALPSIGTDERQINKSVWVDDLIERKREGFTISTIEVLRKLPAPYAKDTCLTKNEIEVAELDERIYEGSEPYGFKAAWSNDQQKKEALKNLASEIIGDEYVWSASRINKYLKCSLSALPEFLLGIRDKQGYEESLTRLGRGNIAHEALKEAVKVLASGRKEGKLTAGDCLKKAKEAAANAMSYDKAFKYADASEQVWNLMVDGIREAVMLFLEEEAAYLWDQDSGGKFEPLHFEISFPQNSSPQDINIGSRRIRYSAKVDRIDKVIDGGDARCVVYDYKTGSPPEPKSDCQVAFYSIICAQALAMKPVASLYLSIISNGEVKTMRDASRRGIFLEKYMEALGYTRVNASKEGSLKKTSLLKVDSDDPDEILRLSDELLDQYIGSISGGEFLEHIKVSERQCENCILKVFCAPLRLGVDGGCNGEGDAADE